MARGYGYGKLTKAKENRTYLFKAGLVDGISWTHQGGGSYSIGERINLSTSSSDYHVTGQYCSPLIDLTNYTKLHFTIISASAQNADGRAIGIGTNTSQNSWTYKAGAGTNADFVMDITNYTGSYYVKLYTSSQNRYGSSMSISHIWLE